MELLTRDFTQAWPWQLVGWWGVDPWMQNAYLTLYHCHSAFQIHSKMRELDLELGKAFLRMLEPG